MSKGTTYTHLRRSRRRRSDGQSLVEFAILMPFLLMVVTGTFAVWAALHQDIGLTNAARAGAIEASSVIDNALSTEGGHPGGPHVSDECTALKQAQQGVASEEAVALGSINVADPAGYCTGFFPSTCPGASSNPCVSMSYTLPGGIALSSPGQAYYVVSINLVQHLAATVPLVSNITVQAQAQEATA